MNALLVFFIKIILSRKPESVNCFPQVLEWEKQMRGTFGKDR